MNKGISKAEAILKVVMTPQDPMEGFIENYIFLICDRNTSNFQKILDLKVTQVNFHNLILAKIHQSYHMPHTHLHPIPLTRASKERSNHPFLMPSCNVSPSTLTSQRARRSCPPSPSRPPPGRVSTPRPCPCLSSPLSILSPPRRPISPRHSCPSSHNSTSHRHSRPRPPAARRHRAGIPGRQLREQGRRQGQGRASLTRISESWC